MIQMKMMVYLHHYGDEFHDDDYKVYKDICMCKKNVCILIKGLNFSSQF